MRIYIDEAGAFLAPNPPPRTSFSLVLALMIPTAVEDELLYEFLRLRDTWPNRQIEIKGSSLDEQQASQVVNMAARYDVLVTFMALDTNTHPTALVEKFKNEQANNVTANITREHHPGPILHLHQLGEAVRSMPNQLFLQAFVTWQLIIRVIREGTLYYVQRRPMELSDIRWIIDRKDRAITQMEETWSTLILPLSESAFGREPLICIAEEDYSHFNARYALSESTADPETLKHSRWVESVYGNPSSGQDRLGVDAKRLLTEQRTFEDSRNSLGLQLADMLAAVLRRALNNRLQFPGWKDFGCLLVRHHNSGTGFMQLGSGPPTPIGGHLRAVCKALDMKAKNMVIKRDRAKS